MCVMGAAYVLFVFLCFPSMSKRNLAPCPKINFLAHLSRAGKLKTISLPRMIIPAKVIKIKFSSTHVEPHNRQQTV